MKWMIENISTRDRLPNEFANEAEAKAFRTKMGPVLSEMVQVVAVGEEGDNPELIRMLSEGLVRGDLRDIILPRLSVDEYVSSDPESDNVVLAFFVKGVPEAVLPLKNFCEHCEGVDIADYASSETIEDCYIVYVEMDRPTVKVQNITDLLSQVCMVADMDPEDFTLTFPNTAKKYPYDPAVIEKYFQFRSEEESLEAQKAALAQHEQEQEQQPAEVREALINHMVRVFG